MSNESLETNEVNPAASAPDITMEDRCEMCKFAMHQLVAMLKNDFAITDEEFAELQEKVRLTLDAVRPSEEAIINMSPEEGTHSYGLTLVHYALLVYCSAGTMKNAIEPVKANEVPNE